MVEQNGHDATDLCTTALSKWEPAEPRFNFNRLDVPKVVLSPLLHDPTLQVDCIALFCRVTAPSVGLRELDTLKMVGELGQGCCPKTNSRIGGVDLVDQATNGSPSRFGIGVLVYGSNHALAID